MKKYVILTLIISFCFAKQAISQTSDPTVNALLAIDENQYIGKPLDSIINVIPTGYNQIKIISGGHQYTARKLRIRYPGEIYLELHVRVFTNMNPIDTNRIWNSTLMKREKLYRTVIYKNNDCFRNCDVR